MDVNDALHLARSLMDANRCAGVKLAMNRRTSSFGRCVWEGSGEVRIELSTPLTLANPVEVVRDTILHEIAHAHAGADAGHGPAWQTACLAIGGTPSPCKTFGEGDVKPPAIGWLGVCPTCGAVNHMRTAPTRRRSCSRCAPKGFDPARTIVWENQRTHERLTHRPRWTKVFV